MRFKFTNLIKPISLIVVLLVSMIVPSWLFATSTSTKYQLGYAALDGGGGAGSTLSHQLQASSIGKNVNGFSSSGSFMTYSGIPVIDDDGDGLDSGVEQLVFMTDPNSPFSDEDGLTDGEEVITYNTDPLVADSDMDDFSDSDEVAAGSDPLNMASTPLSSPAVAEVPMPLWSLILMALLLLAISHKKLRAHRVNV